MTAIDELWSWYLGHRPYPWAELYRHYRDLGDDERRRQIVGDRLARRAMRRRVRAMAQANREYVEAAVLAELERTE